MASGDIAVSGNKPRAKGRCPLTLNRNGAYAEVRLALALVALLLLAACRSPAAGAPDAVTPASPARTAAPAEVAQSALPAGSIAVLLPGEASGSRWAAHDRPAFETCLDAAGAPYAIYSAADDAAAQRAQAAEAAAGGAKVLVLAPVDDTAGAAILAEARAAGVKVIAYDRLIPDVPGAELYVAFDDVAAGRLMGETLSPLANALPSRRRNVALLPGPAADSRAVRLREGLLAAIQPSLDNGRWVLAGDAPAADWSAEAGAAAFAELLDRSAVEIGAVFAAGDALAAGVNEVLRARGLAPVLLSGDGASVAGLRAILSGEQTMTLYRPYRLLAETACQAAVAMLNGDEVVSFTTLTVNNGAGEIPFIRLMPIAVTRDNLAQTIIADGFHTWEEICAGEYAGLCGE